MPTSVITIKIETNTDLGGVLIAIGTVFDPINFSNEEDETETRTN
jgi:hypothetical protein